MPFTDANATKIALAAWLAALAFGLGAAPPISEAQPGGKIPRVGVLSPGYAASPHEASFALRRGLQERGYLEGQTIITDIRWDEGKPERFEALAADLVRDKVDVIVAGTAAAIPAAMRATTTIPIVMATAFDPVERGWVASLARPGGNVTGLILVMGGLSSKRLQLLKEAVPGLSRVVVLWNSKHGPALTLVRETELAAREMGIQVRSTQVDDVTRLEAAFQEAKQGGAQAAVMIQSPFFIGPRKLLGELGLKYRMPTLAAEPGFAQLGGLMNYGPSPIANWHRAAGYVDRILKGAAPADLPVEEPALFELAINVKTAKALGLTLTRSLLLRADQVIE